MSSLLLGNSLNNLLVAIMCLCVLSFAIPFILLQRSAFREQQKSMDLIQRNFIANYGAYIPHDLTAN